MRIGNQRASCEGGLVESENLHEKGCIAGDVRPENVEASEMHPGAAAAQGEIALDHPRPVEKQDDANDGKGRMDGRIVARERNFLATFGRMRQSNERDACSRGTSCFASIFFRRTFARVRIELRSRVRRFRRESRGAGCERRFLSFDHSRGTSGAIAIATPRLRRASAQRTAHDFLRARVENFSRAIFSSYCGVISTARIECDFLPSRSSVSGASHLTFCR